MDNYFNYQYWRLPIEFNVGHLNLILGTESEGIEICTSIKELIFNDFLYVNAVRNICRRSDLSDDNCHILFCSQLLSLQI